MIQDAILDVRNKKFLVFFLFYKLILNNLICFIHLTMIKSRDENLFEFENA